MSALNITAMIPARMGSKRVKFKNLRLLDGKPLIHHVLGTIRDTGRFNTVYINSEDPIFEPIAHEFGAQFYRRPDIFSSDTATNDQFMNDFLTNVECDYVVQVNPTSPLFTVDDIGRFTDMLVNGGYDALHAVKEMQMEALLDNKPLNFDPAKPKPRSQDLTPVLVHAGGLMGWKRSAYLASMAGRGSATYIPQGKMGYFPIDGFSQIDIDTEEDFQLAELALAVRRNPNKFPACFPDYLKDYLNSPVA